MPHGRIRKKKNFKTYMKRRDRFTALRRPIGHGTWLNFAIETFTPPGYIAESARGTRYHVLHQDPKSVRRFMRIEMSELQDFVFAAVETALLPEWADLHEHLISQYLWMAMKRIALPPGVSIPDVLVRKVEVASRHLQLFPVVYAQEGEPSQKWIICWTPITEWEKEFKEWMTDRKRTTR